METINTVITAVSIIICLVLIAYFIRWSAWKRVKPAYVRRNVMNFSWIQAVFLIAALLVNGIVMDIRGESGDYYALIPIIASVLLGIMCREALLKNYQEKVVEGKSCHFMVANVFEKELQGYAILEGNNWLPAKAPIAPGTFMNYEEHQQMVAVICSGRPGDKFIVVRI